MGRAAGAVNADELHEQDMLDPEYRREYERTRLANDVAIKVIRYRADHGLSQSGLARLADVLGLDFSLDIKRGRLALRSPVRHAAADDRVRKRA